MRLRQGKNAVLLAALFFLVLNIQYWRRVLIQNQGVNGQDAETTIWSLAKLPATYSSLPHNGLTTGHEITSHLLIALSEIMLSFDQLPQDAKARATSDTRARCVTRGMQTKCYFSNLMVQNNKLTVFGNAYKGDGVPNPIYPPDGQVGPLVQYHKYRGHSISEVNDAGNVATGNPHCDQYITRPTVFLYRMSGHSTYHLWENNLGPFYATLNDDFGFRGTEQEQLKARLNSPSELLIAFVDNKPLTGPKAPHLLSKLLQLFTRAPLINASALSQRVCFTEAIVGISSSSFHHRALLYRMMDRVAGYSPPDPLPIFPKVLYISRNHPSVIRGRKVSNEAEVIAAWNKSLIETFSQMHKEHAVTGHQPSLLNVIHMEDYSFEEQIRMAMKTHIILSPHGGGVTNCIWMREGSITVEFVAPVGKSLPNMYHTLCSKSGVTHFHFLADPDPLDEGVDMKGNARLFSNMVIPPARAVENLQKALRLYQQNREKEISKMRNNVK